MIDLRFTLAVLALLCGAASAEEPAAVPRGPYLQMATPESVTIVWRSDRPIEPVVHYGVSLDAMESVEADRSIGSERKTRLTSHHRSFDPGVCSRSGWAVSS
jgi:hypothetical protein